MLIKYTAHALLRINERDISKKLISNIIENPNKVIFDKNGDYIAQKQIQAYLYRIFYKKDKVNNWIIVKTIYKTSKLKKYS